MAPEVYELVAMGMRYWFVFLGALIAISCWRWLRADSRAYQDALSLLPDAGLVGELVDMATGENIPLPREGTLGSGSACDMRVEGLRKREVSLEFEEGKGVKVIPLRGSHPVTLDGAPARNGSALHGTRIAIGDRRFRVRLFAGLDVPDRVVAAPQHEHEWADQALHEAQDAVYENDGVSFEHDAETGHDVDSDGAMEAMSPEAPQAVQEDVSQQTWQYAIPPEWMHLRPSDVDGSNEAEPQAVQRPPRRRRRSNRRER